MSSPQAIRPSPGRALERILKTFASMSGGAYAALFTAALILTRAPLLLTDILNIDEGVWWMAARMWRAGGVPYVDFLENKPPMIYLFYALPQVLGIDSLWGVHILAIFWTAAAALVMGKAAALFCGRAEDKPAVERFAALFYLLLTAAGVDRQFLFPNTETVAFLPLAGGFYFYIRARQNSDSARDFLASGFLIALAGLSKQTFLACGLPIGIELFWPREEETTAGQKFLGWLRRNSIFGIGFLIPWGIFVVYLLIDGNGAEAYYWLLKANTVHFSMDPGLAFQIKRFLKNTLPPVLAGLPAWIYLVVGLFRRGWPRNINDRLLGFLAANALLYGWATSLAGRWLGHYYMPALIPLALVVTGQLAQELGATGETRPRLALPGWATLAVAAGATVFLSIGTVRTLAGKTEETGRLMKDAAARVQRLTRPDEHIYIWGFGSTLYYRSRRISENRFLTPYTSMSGYLFGAQAAFPDMDPWKLIIPEFWDQFMTELRKEKPALFLDFAEHDVHYFGHHRIEKYPELAAWLSENYLRLPDEGPIVFYQRKDKANIAN